MIVLGLVLGAGVLVGGTVALLARRWPQIEAPRLAGSTIVSEVKTHPRVADHLRQHFDPRTEAGVAMTVAAAAVAAAAVGVGVLLAMVRTKAGFASWDYRIARYGADRATAFSTDVMRSISLIGGTSGVILIAVGACAVELVRRPSRAIPVFLTLVVAGQFAWSNLIKYAVERARPDLSRLTSFAGASFPSGHATAAAATLAAVALVMTRGRSRRTKIAASACACGVAAMVGATRVMLGVHWFTDVLAGLLLGWGWFALCSIAFGGRLLAFGQPVEAAEAVADVTGGSVPTR